MTVTTPTIAALLVDSKRAAEMLGVSTRTLFSLTKSGKLPCIKPTAWSVRYALADLQAFIDRQRHSQDGAA